MASIAATVGAPITTPSIQEICDKHPSLYKAQKAAHEAIQKFIYPKTNADDSFAWKATVGLYNLGYTVVATTVRVVQVVAGVFYAPIHFIGKRVCPTNPITGEWYLPIIPRRLEQAIGSLAFAFATMGTTKEFGSLSDQTPISRAVSEVFTKLERENTELLNPYPTSRFNYQVTTISSSSINAFCVPGGSIVVFSKIIKQIDAFVQNPDVNKTITITQTNGESKTVDLSQVKRDDMIAALLGHEMTHAASRHSLFAIASLIVSLLISLTKTISAPSEEEPLRSKYLADAMENAQSRKNEYEADITGAYFAQRAGYSPLGAIALQQMFDDESWIRKYFEFFYTHPCGENRKRALYAGLQELGVNFRNETENAV